MDLYLHTKSKHHPLQKEAVLKMLIFWARTICKAESLDKGIDHLRKTIRQNGYSSRGVKRALTTKQKPQIQKEKLADAAIIPFQKAVSNKISRLLIKYVKTIDNPVIHIHMFRHKLGLKVAGIYCVPCKYGKAHVEQTDIFIETRCKEHMRHILCV
jgi:hypothetical protein